MSVKNSIKVGPLGFLLQIFVITENIMKRPVFAHNRVSVSGRESNISGGHSVRPGSVVGTVSRRLSWETIAFSGCKPVCAWALANYLPTLALT